MCYEPVTTRVERVAVITLDVIVVVDVAALSPWPPSGIAELGATPRAFVLLWAQL